MNREEYRKFVIAERIALSAACIGLLGWLFCVDLVPSGRMEVHNDFYSKSSRITDLKPEYYADRVGCDEKDECYRDLWRDPVFFDVTIPRNFARAKVIVKYQNQDNYPFIQTGVKRDGDGWDWALAYVEHAESQDFNYEEAGGWRISETAFSLDDTLIDGNVVHFMLSVPGLMESGSVIRVDEIRVVLEREPVTPENFWPRVGKKIRSLLPGQPGK